MVSTGPALALWRPSSQSSERRTREHRRAAEGAEAVEFCSVPSRLEDLGERRELPQRGPGRSAVAYAEGSQGGHGPLQSLRPKWGRRKKEMFGVELPGKF